MGRVAIKIRLSSVMRNQISVSRDFMDSVAEQVARPRVKDVEILIISSGAVAIGFKAMRISSNSNDSPMRQAASALGQRILMEELSECFQRHGMIVGQVLTILDNNLD